MICETRPSSDGFCCVCVTPQRQGQAALGSAVSPHRDKAKQPWVLLCLCHPTETRPSSPGFCCVTPQRQGQAALGSAVSVSPHRDKAKQPWVLLCVCVPIPTDSRMLCRKKPVIPARAAVLEDQVGQQEVSESSQQEAVGPRCLSL